MSDGLFPPEEWPVQRDAVLSEDGVYRYELTRFWGDPEAFVQKHMTFIMLNPSTADADLDDPTIRRCVGFARREGYHGIRVVNLYALRTTRPVHLWEHPDPVGPDNDRWVRKAFLRAYSGCSPVVAAWGTNAKPARVAQLQQHAVDCGVKLQALKVTKDGTPGHPLYLRLDAELREWS